MSDPVPPGSHDLDLSDPFVAYLLAVGRPVDVATVDLDTPLLVAMRAAGVALAVPIIAHGDIVGVLSVGARRDGNPYDRDDRRLLARLSEQAAPALRLAQVMRTQAAQVQERERITQELRVARLIQQQFLPSGVPEIGGWRIATYYRPAREVGGDFYDFLDLPDGRVGIVIGDVTDKGVPAALVMATTRGLVREIAHQGVEPAEVLARVNDRLVDDIPPSMFVTCQFAAFDPASGALTLANAGHCLPFVRHDGGACEVRVTGMPLGLMPDRVYDQLDLTVAAGSCMLFHSDGLAEARDDGGDLFGIPRIEAAMVDQGDGAALIDALLAGLADFAADPAAIEDDVTLVALEREPASPGVSIDRADVLDDFSVASVQGNEREARLRIARSVEHLGLPSSTVERLKTAAAEAVMNAIEHGNGFDPRVPVDIRVLASNGAIVVEVYDRGGDTALPAADAPDIDAKVKGDQSPRGWGLFLIENMTDHMDVDTLADRRRVRFEIAR